MVMVKIATTIIIICNDDNSSDDHFFFFSKSIEFQTFAADIIKCCVCLRETGSFRLDIGKFMLFFFFKKTSVTLRVTPVPIPGDENVP